MDKFLFLFIVFLGNVYSKCNQRNLEINFFGNVIEMNNEFFPKDIEFASYELSIEARLKDNFSNLDYCNWDNLVDWLEGKTKEFELDNWGKYLLIENVLNNFYTSFLDEDFLVLKWYILSKSGFDALIVFDEIDQVGLFMRSAQSFKGRSFVNYKSNKYFYLEGAINKITDDCFLFDEYHYYFANKLQLDFSGKLPKLKDDYREVKMNIEFGGKMTEIGFRVNSNYSDFLSSLPEFSDPSIYSNLKLSNETHLSLRNSMLPILDKMSTEESVNFLLSFSQQEIYYIADSLSGPDDWKFPEETLIIGGGDCEDKSILFSYLVEDLLGLETILLKYPLTEFWGHVNVGVNVLLKDKSELNSFSYEGKEFFICEPSGVGRSLGNNPEVYRKITPKVIDHN